MIPLPDTKNTHRLARFGRAVAASIAVMGFAALIAVRAGPELAPASAHPAFLHAPAAESTVPSAEHVFASRPTTEEATSPTF